MSSSTTSHLSSISRLSNIFSKRRVQAVGHCLDHRRLLTQSSDCAQITPNTRPRPIPLSPPTTCSPTLPPPNRPMPNPRLSPPPRAPIPTALVCLLCLCSPLTQRPQALNQHSGAPHGYEVGIAHDRGQRRTMEDAYSFVVDFAGVRGQGYFAIFDGHAGKHAAEWCGHNFHQKFLSMLSEFDEPVPDIFNRTFHAVDKELSEMAAQGTTHSGCTVVTAFLRLEDSDGKPVKESNAQTRRVLYTANVGDARGVLCRAGKAVRLTYDHKGSDKQEAKRIVDAGGFVLNNRVNGVLAVTRSLGDSAMKEFVVGSPYTTETELSDDDEFIILACDGLWDVVDDQAAVDIVRKSAPSSAQDAAKALLDHALANFSMDNVSVVCVRFLPK
ncbi:Protein phosphatase 2C 1 [Ceratobasidium sp. 394]|nr:Protein phosphatase 2C 1 [Ceratobasidium sp. 394]